MHLLRKDAIQHFSKAAGRAKPHADFPLPHLNDYLYRKTFLANCLYFASHDLRCESCATLMSRLVNVTNRWAISRAWIDDVLAPFPRRASATTRRSARGAVGGPVLAVVGVALLML